MKDRTPHLCRNALGTAICASNGIGPGRSTFPRHRLQHCVVCSRWWKATAVSTHLTIWTEMPEWIIRMLWHSIWESAENHPTKEWQTAPEWIRDGYLRQAIEVLSAADQADGATASDYKERMRVEYQELTGRADKLRDMLQRYADGTLDFEPICPISLLSRQLDVMDEYANLLRHRAKIEHVHLEKQDSATE